MSETFTVSQLNTRVRSLLGSAPELSGIWVTGEISNLTKHSSGHYYFTLKDSGSEIRCSLFKGARARVPFEPNENMKVAAFGHVDLYVQRGQYQFVAETMRASGIGDLYAAYEKLKRKLDEEGLFDPSKKKAIPKYPLRVGVVTSPTGAVIKDIENVAGRRFPVEIVLYPALVQGEGAPASIVEGIRSLNKENVDVMIVGRGGGSIEDLWAFNSEDVARAIAASSVPVISAVGHETDFTIADLAADVRAPTPSAAAEIALPDRNEELRGIERINERLAGSLDRIIRNMGAKFGILDAKLSPKRAMDTVGRLIAELDGTGTKADALVTKRINALSGHFDVLDAKLSPKRAMDTVCQFIIRLDDISDGADTGMERVLKDKRKDADAAAMRLDGLDPNAVIRRGYAVVSGIDGKPVTSVSGIHAGSLIGIRMRDGTAEAEIKKVNGNG